MKGPYGSSVIAYYENTWYWSVEWQDYYCFIHGSTVWYNIESLIGSGDAASTRDESETEVSVGDKEIAENINGEVEVTEDSVVRNVTAKVEDESLDARTETLV